MAIDIIARGLSSKKAASYIFVENYSDLPTVPLLGQIYYCMNSEGTYWLPGTLGGTYHPAGPYIYDGMEWVYIDSTLAATQEEVNAGIEGYKFVSPNTLKNSSIIYNLEQAILGNYDELEMQIPWKIGNDLYQEFEYSGENISKVHYWIDNTKITKLFTKTITYDGNNPTVIVLVNEINSKILTTTITYFENEVVNVTKTMI